MVLYVLSFCDFCWIVGDIYCISLKNPTGSSVEPEKIGTDDLTGLLSALNHPHHRTRKNLANHVLTASLPRLLCKHETHSFCTVFQGFGFRFWHFTGPERNGQNSGISVLLVVQIRISRQILTKFYFLKKNYAKFPSRFRLVNHLPIPAEMGEIQTNSIFSGKIQICLHGRTKKRDG
jgi:hypothetical protein